MKTIFKVLIPVTWIALTAYTCNQCQCDHVLAKESVAAGWCTLTIQYCNGTSEQFAVDEVVYNSYNVGDCYP